MELLEAQKDLSIYKRLVQLLGDYQTNVPATGISNIFNKLLDKGIKAIPKDKTAQAILSYILFNKDQALIIECLLNQRFAKLPALYRPTYKDGNKKLTAFWFSNDNICDKSFNLLNLEDSIGHWCDESGKSVKLINV
jgi:hypothetical protein